MRCTCRSSADAPFVTRCDGHRAGAADPTRLQSPPRPNGPSRPREDTLSYAANEPLARWLSQETPEEALEPALRIVDPHHHLWDIRQSTAEPLKSFEQKVYLCEEIVDDIRGSGHNVVQTVFAQCGAFYRADGPQAMRCVGETEFVHGIYAMSNSGVYGDLRLCTGIFGSADLRLGRQVEPVLQAHLAASPNFRGVRTAFPSDLDEQFLQGYALLAKHELTFDNWSPDFGRLPTLARLANANSDVTVIVNHLGGKIDPAAPAEDLARWRAGIDAVARCSNTVMKCGGGQMRVGNWEPPFHMHQRATPMGSDALCDLLFPFYQYVIEAFGPERCMFESNFPVDKECVSYRTLWNVFKRIAARLGLSASEKAAIFAGTATRVYRLQAR
ncbi:MAG: amidohydrolase family protein [Gammaproteobacteria bacterium]|nr:amidohydrolase family protein [Gammaproteobacteria bacterium]